MIEIRDLSARYHAEPVLENVSFSVESGDYLCIVGTNGSGKSTLLKVILGLVKPTKGSVVFSDESRAGIGYLPQQTEAQRDFPASVWEVVLSGFTGLAPTPAQKQRARENLRRLGMDGLERESFSALSGGQRQRVLLARALCATEKILLLDEPAGGLDPLMSAALYDLLAALHRDGVTIVMVSHDITGALRHGQKILHLDRSVAYFGPAADYPASQIGKCMCGGCSHDS
ncbi:MAG: ABC transporter ATP-binding protein [Clostridiales bacterium]|nr:ABC transporter ATP-binding protein [Clostridiales bacterium]